MASLSSRMGARPGLIFSRDGFVWVASGDPRVRRWPNAYVCREAGRVLRQPHVERWNAVEA